MLCSVVYLTKMKEIKMSVSAQDQAKRLQEIQQKANDNSNPAFNSTNVAPPGGASFSSALSTTPETIPTICNNP